MIRALIRLKLADARGTMELWLLVAAETEAAVAAGLNVCSPK